MNLRDWGWPERGSWQFWFPAFKTVELAPSAPIDKVLPIIITPGPNAGQIADQSDHIRAGFQVC